jgi:acetylornithine deacetylase
LYPDYRAPLPCSVCMFHAGTFPSAVPDTAVLRGSLGVMPQEEVKDVERQVVEQIMRVSRADAWLRHHPPVVEFKEVGADGSEIPVDHPSVQTVGAAFHAVTGTPLTISGRTDGADTRYLITHGQTSTVIFGPGLTSEMHAVNESVPVVNLLTATKTLALAIVEWCGLEGP